MAKIFMKSRFIVGLCGAIPRIINKLVGLVKRCSTEVNSLSHTNFGLMVRENFMKNTIKCRKKSL